MLTGRCQCGATGYQVTGEPLDVYICHCTECRRQSASAFGISVIVQPADFKLTSGEPKIWSRIASRTGSLECLFCPTCGTRICHRTPAPNPTLSVKGGSFDQPPDLSRAKHIWTSSRLTGVEIPMDAESYSQEPPTDT